MATRSWFCVVLLFLVAFQSTVMNANVNLPPPRCRPVLGTTREKLLFALNMHIFKATFFLGSSFGRRINDVSPGLVEEAPAPIGVTIANLDIRTRRFIEESGLASVGHIRAIANVTLQRTPLPMPMLNLSAQVFAQFLTVLNVSVSPPFNIYANTASFQTAAAFASYLLQVYYAGISSTLVGDRAKEVAAGIGLYEAASYGAIRSQLNERANSPVPPYTFTVANLTNFAAQSSNQLGGCGVKNEGLVVPLSLGAEGRTTNNVIAADGDSLSYKLTELEVLRILFVTGNATRPGGIFPNGFNGTIYRRVVNLNQS